MGIRFEELRTVWPSKMPSAEAKHCIAWLHSLYTAIHSGDVDDKNQQYTNELPLVFLNRNKSLVQMTER